MSCTAGHSEWISTTNGACFATVKGRFQSCFCPISTCARGSDGYYSCEFTYLSYFIIYFMVAALIGTTVAFYVYSKKISRANNKKVGSVMDWKHYTDTMFGVYHANAGEDDHTTKEVGEQGSVGKGSDPSSGAATLTDSERKGLLSADNASYGGTEKKGK
eukprot:GILI01034697.1.p1 GENE.GILI01034697.1~~GILI01034697.1.p1  ORF type:complete len:160 (+),score=26.60 GILI01034697.1:62-541(+)